LALPAMVLAACAGKKDEIEYVERPVETLYNMAVDKVADKNYREAALYFDEVERQHPYSVWARRSMLMSAYSYYQSNKYEEAIDAAQRFISLHPGNQDAPYAYYLIAISYYEQISDVGRDQQKTLESMNSLQEVVRRYPQSEYARDARLKIDMTRDHLAGKEMDVGRYYLTRGQTVSAINRFRTVVENYQTTSHVPEALHRLTEAYLTLGIVDEAQTAAAVLGYNYPGSEWYDSSYKLLVARDLQPAENKKSWISRTWNAVF
jgi:outer membrane protein assembly factor BamD